MSASFLERSRRTEWSLRDTDSHAVFDFRTPDAVWVQTELVLAWVCAVVDIVPFTAPVTGPLSDDVCSALIMSLERSFDWLASLDARLFAAAAGPRCPQMLLSFWAAARPTEAAPAQSDPDVFLTTLRRRHGLLARIGTALSTGVVLPGHATVTKRCAAVWKRSLTTTRGALVNQDVAVTTNEDAFVRTEFVKVSDPRGVSWCVFL